MDDENELHEIMSESVETPITTETVTAPTEPTAEARARDEAGRFATKAEQPAAVVTPPAEGEPVADEGTVPQQALHAARQKEREARDENADLRRQLQQMQQAQQRPAAVVEPPKPAPDFWENPAEFVRGSLTPVQDMVQQRIEGMSRHMAVKEHGLEVVQGAYQALGQAIQSDPKMLPELHRIMATPHPFDELVSWHAKHKASAEIGNDPAAYKERLRAEIMAEMAAAPAATTTPAPSTATRPNLPPSLNRIPGAGNGEGDADTSDQGIFRQAMAR